MRRHFFYSTIDSRPNFTEKVLQLRCLHIIDDCMVLLRHEPLAWSSATITRAPEPSRVTVPAGSFEVTVYAVEVADGRTLTFAIENAAPHRLVRQTGSGGEELALTGSKRLPYWQLNGPGGERYLEDIGLATD